MILTVGKKLVNVHGHAPTFGELCLKMVRAFCLSPKFSNWEAQRANFGTCYVVAQAYSLKQ